MAYAQQITDFAVQPIETFVERLLEHMDAGQIDDEEERVMAAAMNEAYARMTRGPDGKLPELEKVPDVWHVKGIVQSFVRASAQAALVLSAELSSRGIEKVTVQIAGHVETLPAHVGFLNVHVWPVIVG